jgi:tRNA-2-methylthio-N6-dimethylallyladenosine synthase
MAPADALPAVGGGTVRFSDLLARVSAVPGLRRLRFVTSHPLDFGDDILQAMRDLPNVCPYIHCPAQSGSDAVLARMKRGYTRSQYDDLMDRARAIVPGVVLSGDFIVGFSGETEADHEASADLIRRSGYKNSFIFKYSPREGTLAARKFADDVPDAVKKRRNKELLAVQKEVAYALHKTFVGKTLEVLVEGPSPLSVRDRRKAEESHAPAAPGGDDKATVPHATQLVGRTTGDHIVVFDGPPELADQYIHVEITSAEALTLTGRRVGPKG